MFAGSFVHGGYLYVDFRWADRIKYSLKVGEPLVNSEYNHLKWEYDSDVAAGGNEERGRSTPSQPCWRTEPADRVDTAGLSSAVSRPLAGRAAVLLCALRRGESILDFVIGRRHALGVHRFARRPSC